MAKVLIVEPDKLLADDYSLILTKSGYQVEVVKNIENALDSMDSILPDVLVTELNIAGHNGLELLYEIRSYTDWRSLPVIVNSFAVKDVGEEWLKTKLGVLEAIDKNRFSLEELQNAIQRVTQK